MHQKRRTVNKKSKTIKDSGRNISNIFKVASYDKDKFHKTVSDISNYKY